MMAAGTFACASCCATAVSRWVASSLSSTRRSVSAVRPDGPGAAPFLVRRKLWMEMQRDTGHKRADVAEKRWTLRRTVETVDPLQASWGGWHINVLEKFEPEAACRLYR